MTCGWWGDRDGKAGLLLFITIFFVTFYGKSNQKPTEINYPTISVLFPCLAGVLLW
jgi:hypothetical protein